MSIKKSFLIICLVLCLPIASWATCDLFSREITQFKNRDRIFLHQTDYDNARKGNKADFLLCYDTNRNNAYCGQGTYILVTHWHWVGENGYPPTSGDKVNQVHQCQNYRWLDLTVANLPVCPGVNKNNHDMPTGQKYYGSKYYGIVYAPGYTEGLRIFGVPHDSLKEGGKSWNQWWVDVCQAPLWEKCGVACSDKNADDKKGCDGKMWKCDGKGVWKEVAETSEEKCKAYHKLTDNSKELKQCISCLDTGHKWLDKEKTCDCSDRDDNDGIQWRIFSDEQSKCIDDPTFCGGMGAWLERGCLNDVGKGLIYACFGENAVTINGRKQDAYLQCLGGKSVKDGRWKVAPKPDFNICEVKDATDKQPYSDADHAWFEVAKGLFVNENKVQKMNITIKYGYDQKDNEHWCTTCPEGKYYAGSSEGCILNEREAWCKLRAEQPNNSDLNITWNNDGCKCEASGYKWNDTEHKCDDNRETFCGLVCDKEDDTDNKTVGKGTTVMCTVDEAVGNQTKKKVVVKTCNSDFKWKIVSNFESSIGLCQVENPEKREPLDGGYTKFARDDIVFMKDATKPIADTAPNAYKFDDNSIGNFCRVCENGKYYYYDGANKVGQCLDNSDEAWCKFKNQNWTGTDCNCTEQGKYWNKAKHSCEEMETFCGLSCGSTYDGKIILCRDDDLELRKCIASEGIWKPYMPKDATEDWKTVLGRQCSGAEWFKFSNSGMLFRYKNTDVHPLDENWAKNAYVITDDTFLKENWCLPCPKGKFYVKSDGVGECIDNEQQAKCINYSGAQWLEDPKDPGNYRCICNDPKSHWTGKECRANAETCAERCEKETTSKTKNETYSPKEQCVACCKIGGGVDWNMDNHTCDCKDARKAWNAKTNVCDWTNDEIIKRAVDGVSPFFNNVEKNKTVWRTEEGKFNTARLASDAIAGTVLGTVGGIVSANVIKKNQLAKGYDVLHCAIGGQNVADWGDTFNVLGPKD